MTEENFNNIFERIGDNDLFYDKINDHLYDIDNDKFIQNLDENIKSIEDDINIDEYKVNDLNCDILNSINNISMYREFIDRSYEMFLLEKSIHEKRYEQFKIEHANFQNKRLKFNEELNNFHRLLNDFKNDCVKQKEEYNKLKLKIEKMKNEQKKLNNIKLNLINNKINKQCDFTCGDYGDMNHMCNQCIENMEKYIQNTEKQRDEDQLMCDEKINIHNWNNIMD